MYWYHSPLLSVTHGFSTRSGGISPAPFHSLNFAGRDDEASNIKENRRRALAALNLSVENTAYLKQVHSNTVCLAHPGPQTGDALVTKEKGLTLAVAAADCYPLLFHDPVNNIIGAAHAGWRGTVARVAQNTIYEMVQLGADTSAIKVAIGPGISCEKFEVGSEVIEQFARAGFPDYCFKNSHIDLVAANKFVLNESGIAEENTWAMKRCTFEADFFSFRRDKGKTGRMWAVISL